MPEGQPLCRDFERGACSRGDNCKYSHSRDDSICRDYERGVCMRGENCKFSHPEDISPVVDGKIPICKDFQSKFCNRTKCKFLHLSLEEETEYAESGKLPEHGGHPDESTQSKSFCKDFLNGKCIRGAACKFSHSVSNEYGDMYGKRSRVEYDGPLSSADHELIQENESLMEEIEEVQKQLQSLRQTNDTLFEQNTRFRAQIQGNNNTTTPATTTAPSSLLPLNNQTNQAAYPQYNTNQSTYPQYNQTPYQQYDQSAYSQYSQPAYQQYTQPATPPAYPQYNQSTASQYSQPTYPQYTQTGYTGYWNTYPQYG